MRIFIILWVLWLVLNESLAFGHVLLGAAIALGGAVVHARLRGAAAPAGRRPLVAARLLLVVLADIVRSNLEVGRIVLGLGRRARVSGFLPVPLELRHPGALATLACIVTATPGTSWIRYDEAAAVLTLHVLDLADEDHAVRTFKQRYEQPLMEIFE